MLSGLDHLVITVTDISRAVDFYTRVLGLDVRYFDTDEHGFGSAHGWRGGHCGWHRRCGGHGGWRGGAFGHGGHRHEDGHGPWGRDDARGV